MTQSFTTGYPATSAAAVSLTERGNWNAVLSSHSGATLPGYAVEGMPFYNTTTKHLCVAKPYGTKAFSTFLMGPSIRLAIALAGSGQTGSTYSVLVQVRTNTAMSSADKIWTVSGSAVTLDFNHNYTPAYFAAQTWDDTNFKEPVLWSADGRLLTKAWETIPGTDPGIPYSTSPSPLTNDSPFINTSLRAVDVESKHVKLDFGTLTVGTDHVVVPLTFPWWQVQDDLLDFDLIENGIHRDPATFKCVAFMWGGVVNVVTYNRDPLTPTLLPFDVTKKQTLIVTRKV